MAFPSLSFSKLSANTANFRSCLRCFIEKEKCVKFSTSKILACKNNAPVKYSTTKAASIPISQIIGLEREKNTRLWYEKYVLFGSAVAFMLYFCIFRKENDIDELLKGNPEFEDSKTKLVKLKTQLQYCERNKLPTAALKAKIDELEEASNKHKYPFRK